MPVNTTHILKRYTGTGTSAPYPIDFQFLDLADIRVAVTKAGLTTELTNGVDFVVTGGEGSTGAATLTATYDATWSILIQRSTAIIQEANLIETGQFSARTVERQLDREIFILQEQAAVGLSSCYRVNSESDAPDPVDATSPNDTVLGYDGSGNFILIPRASIGAQGPQGYQGYQGVQGAQGAQGADGAVGAQGEQGIDGAQGFQGNQGVQGAQGNQGAAGSTGGIGMTGLAGGTGSQGDQGYQGYIGPQGDQGYQGFQGDQGDQGAQGSAGIPWTMGAGPNYNWFFDGADSGVSAQGTQGAQGFQGDKGAIIESIHSPTGFARLTCIEAPETRFEDVQRVALQAGVNNIILPVQFVDACNEGTILLSGLVTTFAGSHATGLIRDGTAFIHSDAATEAIITYTGVRKGFGRRFEPMSEDAYKKNLAFWKQQFGQPA